MRNSFKVTHLINCRQLYANLVTQCEKMGIGFHDATPSLEALDRDYGVVVDALFGFSFKPPVRPAFADLMTALSGTKTPVARDLIQ